MTMLHVLSEAVVNGNEMKVTNGRCYVPFSEICVRRTRFMIMACLQRLLLILFMLMYYYSRQIVYVIALNIWIYLEFGCQKHALN